MASTYSSTLRLELIGNGDQSGTWGDTTNLNLGTLLQDAITGVQAIAMTDANYTMTAYNGLPDESRNAVLVVSGTNTAIRSVIAPAVEKTYVVRNNTTGGFGVTIRTSAGTGITVPSGATQIVYCDGSEFYLAASQTTVAAGTGISVATAGVTATVTNTGVTSAVAGTGVSVSGATGAVTFTKSGVTSAVAGTGISVSGATGAVTVTNTGVTGITGSSGITASASTGSVTLSPTSGYNGYGVRTVSTSAPSGGSNGDIWYQY